MLATESQFLNPRGLGFAPNGDIYISDTLNNMVRRIDANGVVHAVAGRMPPGGGGAYAGYSGDGGPALAGTLLNEPHGVAVDSLGNVYIADSKNCVIRKVDINGIITRFAGTGVKTANDTCAKTSGAPDGDALEIALDQPKGLFMTRLGGGNDTLWIADWGNNQIRKIDVVVNGATVLNPQNVRVAGTNRARHYGAGFEQDALDPEFRHPEAVWVAADGTLYVSDGGNNLIRKIATPAPGSTVRKVSVIAGDVAAAVANANSAYDLDGNSDGDGGVALNAHLDRPRGVSGDNQGNLYVAEEHGSRIRRINLNTGIIQTVAGDGTILEQRANGGTAFIKGENGPALETQFAMLHDIQVNPADGSLWIADSRNNRVRAVFGAASAPGANIGSGGGTAPPAPTTTTTRPPATASSPGAPGTGSATGLVSTNRAVGVATVSWTAPADGGTPITAYQITAMPGGLITTVAAPSTSGIVSNLQNGTSYTFTVRAQNALGLGAASLPMGPAVPYSVPAPGAGVQATLTGGTAVVQWDTPADDGGRPVTGYQITVRRSLQGLQRHEPRRLPP